MRKILYLLTKDVGQLAPDVIPKNPVAGDEISVILMQGGISLPQVHASHVYTLSDDTASKNECSSFPSVSYQDVLRMVFEADGVVVV